MVLLIRHPRVTSNSHTSPSLTALHDTTSRNYDTSATSTGQLDCRSAARSSPMVSSHCNPEFRQSQMSRRRTVSSGISPECKSTSRHSANVERLLGGERASACLLYPSECQYPTRQTTARANDVFRLRARVTNPSTRS